MMDSIDPFPPPSALICEQFGRTAFYAQKLERELKMFLLACHHSDRIKLKPKKNLSLEDSMERVTLGNLHDELIKAENRHGYSADANLHDQLEKAVDNRNLLAHRFFQNFDPLNSKPQDEERMIKDLGEIRLSVGNAYLIMRALRKRAEADFGITEENLEKMLLNLDEGLT